MTMRLLIILLCSGLFFQGPLCAKSNTKKKKRNINSVGQPSSIRKDDAYRQSKKWFRKSPSDVKNPSGITGVSSKTKKDSTINKPKSQRSKLPDIQDIEKKMKRRKALEKKQGPNMGKELKQFGERVASGIDRLIKARTFSFLGDPWTAQGLPIIFWAPITEFHLGLRFMLIDIARQDPHKFRIDGQVLASNGGRVRHFLQLDWPHALDGKFNFTGRVAYTQDVTARFYGIGNDTFVDNALVDSNDISYQNEKSYPTFTFSALRRFGKYFRIGPIFGLKWMNIKAPPGSLLASQRPLGIDGGKTHYLGLGMIYSSVDFEPYPSKGNWHELFLYSYPKFLGSTYNFFRATYTFKTYRPLHRRLILAHRTLLEFFVGDVPFYEMNAVGGSDSTLGFGADRFYRGFRSNQFIDRIRLASSLELRWDPVRIEFINQDITFGFVPFIDVGRVWPQVFPIRVGDLQASTGVGFRIIWNHRLVVRTDFALNRQGTSFHVELGNSF